MRALRRDESDETHLLTSNSDGLNFNISVLGTFPQKELLKKRRMQQFPSRPSKRRIDEKKSKRIPFLCFRETQFSSCFHSLDLAV